MKTPTFDRAAPKTVAPVGLLSIWVLLSLPGPAAGQAQEEDWCDADRGDRPGHCEVREYTLSAAPGRIAVDASPNGGVHVEGWDRSEVLVQARVSARAESEARASEIASQIQIETDGEVISKGPKTKRRESWWVSYRVFVPRDYDLELESTNGGVGVEGVNGRIELRTTNGGVSLRDVAGDVRGRTTNGGLSVHLSGDRWQGAGLDVQTTNGGVTLYVPDGYNARLVTGTTNGGFDVEFPITVQGRLGRRIETDLGSGGASIRAVTTNGGVRVRRSD